MDWRLVSLRLMQPCQADRGRFRVFKDLPVWAPRAEEGKSAIRLTVGQAGLIVECRFQNRPMEGYGNTGRGFPRPGDARAQAQAGQRGRFQRDEEAGFL